MAAEMVVAWEGAVVKVEEKQVAEGNKLGRGKPPSLGSCSSYCNSCNLVW